MSLERVTDLRRQMSNAAIDGVVMFPSSNWRYLYSFVPVANERLCMLIVTYDSVAVVLPIFDAEEMRECAGDALIFGWSDQDGPERTLAEAWQAVNGARLKSIAVDDGMPYLFTRLLLAHTRPAALRVLSSSMPRYRLIKNQEEIEAIRVTASVIEQTLASVPAMLSPGMSELELERMVKADLLSHGADTLDYTLVQFGLNSAIPHHVASGKTLERRSNVLLDIAVTHRCYFADITRQVALGKPTRKYLDTFDVVRAAQAAGVAAAVPGAAVHDVDQACRDIIAAVGLSAAFFTRTGHGLGLDVHEPPSVVSGNQLVLEPGMVITVEPGVYLPGEFGVRIEDTIAITESAADRLSASERALVFTELPSHVVVEPRRHGGCAEFRGTSAGLPGHRLDSGSELGDGETAGRGGQGQRRCEGDAHAGLVEVDAANPRRAERRRHAPGFLPLAEKWADKGDEGGQS